MLAWARLRDGVRVNVSELVPRDGRGPFTCPRCGEEVLARLGRVRARHFAHRPGSSCPLTAPESALHHNAKERLLWLCREAFAGRRTVRLGVRCEGCRRPSAFDLSRAGDEAREEGSVGALRADVLVTRGGRPSLALEVRVSHALGPGKEAALASLSLPAAEVDACSEWEREEEAGSLVLLARNVGFPPCSACASLARADLGRARGGEEALVAELEAYRARGLFGPGAGDPLPDPPPFSTAERLALASAFRCPSCRGLDLELGIRLARHACPGGSPRAVAWRGYDGVLVEMGWWRRGAAS